MKRCAAPEDDERNRFCAPDDHFEDDDTDDTY